MPIWAVLPVLAHARLAHQPISVLPAPLLDTLLTQLEFVPPSAVMDSSLEVRLVILAMLPLPDVLAAECRMVGAAQASLQFADPQLPLLQSPQLLPLPPLLQLCPHQLEAQTSTSQEPWQLTQITCS